MPLPMSSISLVFSVCLQFSPTPPPCSLRHSLCSSEVLGFSRSRWRHLHQLKIWPPDGTTCITYKFGQKVAPHALVVYLVTRYYHLYWLQIWPPSGATCISCKFGQQMAPLALVTNLATRWRHLHWLQIWPPDGTTCFSWLHQLESSSVETLSV